MKGDAFKAIQNCMKVEDTLLAVDESTTIKNHKAKQTKAVCKLGELAKFRRILSGQPIENNPMDLYSQFNFLSKA